jgi:GT2 family glycosyltransferase
VRPAPRVAVVVVNWKETATTLDCLRSLRASRYPNVVIVAVDNGSPEDPTTILQCQAPGVEVVRLATNAGFAAGANAGARHAIELGADFLFFLNNDATIDRQTIPALLADSGAHPLSIHAPRIVYARDPGRIWSAGGSIVRPWMKNHHIGQDEPASGHRRSRRVDWATGCAIFAPVAVYTGTGPFDEAFFLYLEDVDWCLRAAARGFPTRYVAHAVVRHAVSTTVRHHLPAAQLRYYAYRNYYRLAFRHAPVWARPLVALELLWTLLKTTLRWTGFPAYRHDRLYHARTRAIADFLRGRWGPAPLAVASG